MSQELNTLVNKMIREGTDRMLYCRRCSSFKTLCLSELFCSYCKGIKSIHIIGNKKDGGDRDIITDDEYPIRHRCDKTTNRVEHEVDMTCLKCFNTSIIRINT